LSFLYLLVNIGVANVGVLFLFSTTLLSCCSSIQLWVFFTLVRSIVITYNCCVRIYSTIVAYQRAQCDAEHVTNSSS